MIIHESDTFDVNLLLLCKLKNNNDSVKLTPKVGDLILVSGTLQKGRERRNPFEFDYNNYLNSKGISGLFYIKKRDDINISTPGSFNFNNVIYSLRLFIAEKINELYDKESAALLRGLLLADRSGIDYDTKEAFVNSGVVHVLAVSGLHVGYVVLIFLFLFSRFNIYFKNIFTIVGLLFFVIITGAPPSVVRASIMAIVLIVYNLSIRSYNNFNSIALAAFIILIINPQELFNPGFLLSFSAVLSIFVIYPVISSYINSLELNSKLLKNVLLFMGVSLAAQIGTLPFTLHYFNKLSIVSLGANLFVIPLIGIIVSLGITSIVFGIISVPLGSCYAFTNELFSYMLFNIVEFMGKWEHSYFYIPQFSFYDALIYYAILSLFFYSIKYFRTVTSKIILITLLLLNSFIFFKFDDNELLPGSILSLMMIDVGQGD
jgi:competence protein ComEC